MATLLYRLGKASYTNAGRVLIAWIMALLVLGGGGIAFSGQTNEEFRIPGSESQAAFDRLEAVFPSFGGGSAQAVLVVPEGDRVDTPENRRFIEEFGAAIEAETYIDGVTTPFDEFAGDVISDDGRYALVQIVFVLGEREITDDILDSLVGFADMAEGTDITIEFGGSLFQDQGVHLTIAEVFGVAFAGLVLIVTFRSFRPAWQPITSALFGVGIAIGIILFSARALTVSSSAPLLAVMLGLAVGIDYSLFILQRHRTQLANGAEPRESAAMAVGTAGNAVVFAGLTVVIALLGLFVVGIPFLSIMGAGAALAVVIAIAAAITLLPAMMGLMGERLRPPAGSKAAILADPHTLKPAAGRRFVRGIMKRPIMVAVLTIAGLATLAIPALQLDLNLPSGGSEPLDSTQRKAFDLVSEGFGPGYNGPLIVAVDITGSDELLDDLEALREEFRAIEGVSSVSEGFPSPSLDTGIFQVIPESAPDSRETKALVNRLREDFPRIEAEFGTPLAVTGVTAIGVDVSQRIQSALIPFGLVVVGLSFILLLLVFRSILVPLKAALGFILSVTAAFGVVVAVFQWGWLASLIGVDTPGPILSFMPIILMAVLFGLAMDYQVFLVSGMREHFVHTGQWRESIEEGYSQGARVVGAAALIMFFVFFAFVPEGIPLIKPIALGLAVGIALDAFVVRMMLVPALMTIFGSWAWALPPGLARILPHADVEGEKLRDHLREKEWALTQSHLMVSAENLVMEGLDQTGPPESWSFERGDRRELGGTVHRSAIVTATLSGALAPVSGSVHVAGFSLPSEAPQVRRIVSIADTRVENATLTLAELVSEYRARGSARGNTQDNSVSRIVSGVNALSLEVCEPSERVIVAPSTPLAMLPRRQQILVLSALAVITNSPLCVVGAGNPVAHGEDASLWWHGLQHFASADQVVLLWSTRTEPDETPVPVLAGGARR
jgi:RND superfamily putative drug exporter